MNLFGTTLQQTVQLLLIILCGYILAKSKILPDSAAVVLSRLENYLLVPALVFSTFVKGFTAENIGSAWQYLCCGLAVGLFGIGAALIFARLLTKDGYIRRIFTYGLAFSNFGFMGNAVVSALFPELFANYLIFVLPLWVLIYVWGVPVLLIPKEDGRRTWKDRIKPFLNPMLAATFAGMAVGLSGLELPSFFMSAASGLGSCMSPAAMLLTGVTVAKTDLKKTLSDRSIYGVSLVRLLLIPAAGLAILALLRLSYPPALCSVCALCMPLGLSTVVVPAAYGKDTSVAAGMALISHLLGAVTIPLVLYVFSFIAQ